MLVKCTRVTMEEHVEISVTEGLAAVADLVIKEVTAKQVKFRQPSALQTVLLSPFFLHSFLQFFSPFFSLYPSCIMERTIVMNNYSKKCDSLIHFTIFTSIKNDAQ